MLKSKWFQYQVEVEIDSLRIIREWMLLIGIQNFENHGKTIEEGNL